MPFELHRAIESGDQQSVKSLINEGADVNEIETENKTPLFYAITNNNLELVKVLLDHGAKICLNDYSYLFLAIQQSIILNFERAEKNLRVINYQIVRLLIDRGGNVNQLANDGTNILVSSALFSNYYPLVELLLKKGANIEQYKLLAQTAVKLDNSYHNDNCDTASLLIAFNLLRYQPKEKPDFVEENQDLSAHWDRIMKKIDELRKRQTVGVERPTENFLFNISHEENTLRSAAFFKFFDIKNSNKNISEDDDKTMSTSAVQQPFRHTSSSR